MKSILDTTKLKIDFSIDNEIYYRLKTSKTITKYNHYKAEMRGDKISNRRMIRKEAYHRIMRSVLTTNK